MRIFILGLLLGSSLLSSSLALGKPQRAENLTPDKAWLGREMKRLRLPPSFVKKALKTYEKDSFKTVVTLNLLGFLKPGQHMNHVNPRSMKEAAGFVNDNRAIFAEVEKKYQVPAGVVSSLLWIETRHGEDTGTFHTVSVFMHLLQSDLKKNRTILTKLALERNQEFKKYTTIELKKKMRERTKARRDWAREQLGALAVIEAKKHLNVTALRGSYAGAFGMPQFIPSSYRDFAVSFETQTVPNLSDRKDAIVSVANYLSKHGWINENADAMVQALMKYNNSRDYADSILEIAKRVSPVAPKAAPAKPEERTASQTEDET